MMHIAELNLIAAWSGILLGFLSGLIFGLCFHREDWLGGYGSFKRRLYRLGHISFFGLAIVNFMFYFTARSFAVENQLVLIASWTFIIGAVSMPACCFLVAHVPQTRLLFGIPVMSLLLGAVLTIAFITKVDHALASPKPQEGISRITHHAFRITHHFTEYHTFYENRTHRHERRSRS
jgi:hypothetical protein